MIHSFCVTRSVTLSYPPPDHGNVSDLPEKGSGIGIEVFVKIFSYWHSTRTMVVTSHTSDLLKSRSLVDFASPCTFDYDSIAVIIIGECRWAELSWLPPEIGYRQEIVKAHCSFNHRNSIFGLADYRTPNNSPTCCQNTECVFDDAMGSWESAVDDFLFIRKIVSRIGSHHVFSEAECLVPNKNVRYFNLTTW